SGNDPHTNHNNPNLPLVGVMKEEPIDDYGMDKDRDKELVDQRKSDVEESKLKDLIIRAEKALKDAQTKAAEVKVKQENLMKELGEMRMINGLLATTEAGKIYDELRSARKQIEHLEKKTEVATAKTSNEQTIKRKRTEAQCDNVMMDDLIEKEGEESIGHTTHALTDSMENGMIEKEGKNDTKIDPTPDLKDSSETVEMEKRRRSSRRVFKKKHTESLGDSNSEHTVKKLRSDSEKGKVGSSCIRVGNNRGVKKQNVTELECPECE
ncbi:hypothetical protein PENTCL1PPCAC_8140, partial [Pristionchus entomophagus]